MAIQKISDLSILEPEVISDVSEENRLNRRKFVDSLVEISFPMEEQVEYTKFQSVATTVGTLSGAIISDIIYGDTNYWGSNHFWKPVYAHDSLAISGDLSVNADLDIDDIRQGKYYSFINSTKNTIIAVRGNGDEASGINILSAEVGNYFQSNTNMFVDAENNEIATFYSSLIDFKKNLKATRISADYISAVMLESHDGIFDNLTCVNYIHGTAMSALWADLAEMYDADDEYEPGTLVEFGGEKEITIAKTNVNGVITTKPAFMMNSDIDAEHKAGIALEGRTPVKVRGKVNKFDVLYLSPDDPGIAFVPGKMNRPDKIFGNPVGRSLENKTTDGVGLVEAVVRFNL